MSPTKYAIAICDDENTGRIKFLIVVNFWRTI